MPETKFFTFGCVTCGGLQIGKMAGGPDAIPVFPSKFLAELSMGDFMTESEKEDHPQQVIEICIRIVRRYPAPETSV